jgi:hypothetical protein
MVDKTKDEKDLEKGKKENRRRERRWHSASASNTL